VSNKEPVNGAKGLRRVSILYRVLAWVLFLGFTTTGLAVVINAYQSGSWTFGLSETFLFCGSVLLCYPLFGYVALTGNSPRWMSALEEGFDREFGQDNVRATRLFRGTAFRVILLATCMTLIYVGDLLGLFGDESRGMAILVWR
jgi:hypothetical protein